MSDNPHDRQKKASDATTASDKILDTVSATHKPLPPVDNTPIDEEMAFDRENSLPPAQSPEKTEISPPTNPVERDKTPFTPAKPSERALHAKTPSPHTEAKPSERALHAETPSPHTEAKPSERALHAKTPSPHTEAKPSERTLHAKTPSPHTEAKLAKPNPSIPNGFTQREREPAPPASNYPPILQESVKPKEVKYHLPNAQQNSSYFFDLKELFDKHKITMARLDDPDDTGLTYDNTQKTLQGMITASDGERRLRLKAQDAIDNVVIIDLNLVIVPDPRTLWREIEPTSPFFRKPHCDYRQICTNGVEMVGARVRGRGHANRGEFCDDDFAVVHRPSLGYVGMVADGAGSARFSRLGSQIVVENFPHYLQLELQKLKEKGDYEQWLALFEQQPARALGFMRQMVAHALDSTLRVMQGNCSGITVAGEALSMRDLYTTCLLFWARPLKGNRWAVASFWVGDGGLALRHGGKFSLLGRPDSGENAGQTRFLAWDVLSEEAQKARLQAQIYDDLDEIWAMSDGICDPKFASEAQLANSAAWLALTDDIKATMRTEKGAYEWLHFWSKGDHDDRSFCCFAVKEKTYE